MCLRVFESFLNLCTVSYFFLILQKGDVVRYAVSRPEGACDVTDIEYVTHPINGKAVVKLLEPNQVLEYEYVVETDTAAMTCKVRRLERVSGTPSPSNAVAQHTWQANRSGRNPFSWKSLSWNQALDYVDGAAVVGEIGLRIAFPTPPPILQSSAGPYWQNLTG